MLNPSRIASRAVGACAFALALLSPAYAAPVLQMSAVNSATGVDLTVRAQDMVDLYGFQFTLNFNPSLLSAVSGTEGTFFPSGSSFFDAGTIDNTNGSISFVLGALIGMVNGVDGSGDLATFSFDLEQGGLAGFSLSDILFLDSFGSDIAVESTDLVAQVGEVPEPGSLFLAGIGLAALLGGRKIRHKSA